MRTRWGRQVLVAALLATTLGAPPARAGLWEDAGWGSLSVLSNLGYMPAKLLYATFGAMTGGMAYGLTLGDSQTATTIWETSMGGNYVLTPRMLQGQDPIAFAGTPTGGGSTSTTALEPRGDQGQQVGSGSGSGLQEQPLGGS
jgi:hypothetical protein